MISKPMIKFRSKFRLEEGVGGGGWGVGGITRRRGGSRAGGREEEESLCSILISFPMSNRYPNLFSAICSEIDTVSNTNLIQL